MKKDWTITDEKGNINIPNELMPLFNQIRMQLKLHTIFEKNEKETIAHIIYVAQIFF